MRYSLSIIILVIISACTYVPGNIPIGVIAVDSGTNVIEGLKCTFTRVADNSNVGIVNTGTNGEATIIIQYDNSKDHKTDNDIRLLYQVKIEDVDGTNYLGEFETTNLNPPPYFSSKNDLWVFMIKK